MPSFEKYSNLAITNSKKESDAERKRIAASMVSLKGNLYSNIADDYQQKGDRENAVFYYMKALKIDNTSVWNAYALSNLLLDKGDRYTALKTIDEVSPSVKNTSEYSQNIRKLWHIPLGKVHDIVAENHENQAGDNKCHKYKRINTCPQSLKKPVLAAVSTIYLHKTAYNRHKTLSCCPYDTDGSDKS